MYYLVRKIKNTANYFFTITKASSIYESKYYQTISWQTSIVLSTGIASISPVFGCQDRRQFDLAAETSLHFGKMDREWMHSYHHN